jgi:aldehyde dehydrogenase (NAD+)
VRVAGEALRRHKDALGSLVSLENGKIKAEGDGEVQEMIDMADFAVGLSRTLGGRTLPSERPHHRLTEQWHPLGVVGVVTAFNFPVAVWAWNAFVAAVCGDVTVWRPSPKTPLCAVAAQHVIDRALTEAGFPSPFLLLCEPGTALAERLVDDRRVDLLSFTGSTAVGRQVAQRVAARLGRSLLELGGNNALIVDETADLDLAVPAIVFGAVGTAGQRCTTTRRLLVHASVADALVTRLVHAYRQVRVGDPLDPATLMGPLIDDVAVARYLAAVEEAQLQGGEVLHGGRRLEGRFVEPTLIRIAADRPIVQTETFAPILYVSVVRDLDEAIHLNNAAAHGLSSSLFTSDLRRAERFASATGSDCGIANVNVGTSGAEIGGAFGGEKDTGGGREAGSDAWKAYMRRQTSTVNWGTDLPLAQGIRFDLPR